MAMDGQTDEQLALLASILEPITYPLDRLSSVLKKHRGDISKAAEELLLATSDTHGSGSSTAAGTAGRLGRGSKAQSRGRKEKEKGGLHTWLKGTKEEENTSLVTDSRPRVEEGDGDGSPKPESLDVQPDLKPYDRVEDHQGPRSPPFVPRHAPVDLLKVLRQPQSNVNGTNRPARAAPQRPLVLTSQQAIDAHHLPLSLLSSPLPPSLASALYFTMMKESERWERNKWYLAGKWVESPHLMSGYRRKRHSGGAEAQSGKSDEHGDKCVVDDSDGAAKWYYTGSELKKDQEYPPLLAHAADLIEPIVNAHLAQRPRYADEYAGPWRANVCGANRYDGSASTVGWHADQVTYLGPHCTIASLSLGTPRAFRLRETKAVDLPMGAGVGPTGSEESKAGSGATSKDIRTYEVNLGHNSLILMDPGCQERFKHTVPPQRALDIFRPGWDIDEDPILPEDQKGYTSRINITFRFYRPDFYPLPGIGPSGPRSGTPICKCGVPTLLRADQKAKARVNMGKSPKKRPHSNGTIVEPDSPSKRPKTDGDATKYGARGTCSDIHSPCPTTASRSDPRGELDGKDTSFEEEVEVEEHGRPGTVTRIIPDDMVYFWQCQAPGQTGDLKGCGFFKILDIKAEGRGPCVGDQV